MTIYYVRADGDDLKTGTSDAEAWQSLAKIRAVLASGAVKRGDTIRFRRGDTFPGSIGTIPAASPTDAKLIIGGYGYGKSRPVLDGFKIREYPYRLDRAHYRRLENPPDSDRRRRCRYLHRQHDQH